MTQTQPFDVAACAAEQRRHRATPSSTEVSKGSARWSATSAPFVEDQKPVFPGGNAPRFPPFEKERASPFRRLSGWGAIFSAMILLLALQTDRSDAQPLFEEGGEASKESPRFHFTPSLFISEVYDDNILLRSFRREEDLITRVRPGLAVVVDQARVRWLTELNVEAEFYRDHPDLSTYDRSQILNTHLTLRPDARWTFDFGETFIHSKDPVGRITVGTPLEGGGTVLPIEQGGELVLQRTEYYSNLLSIKGAYRLTPRLTVEVEGIDRITEFKDEALIDVTSDEIRGSLPYVLTQRDTVTPQYQYRNFYFRHRGHTEAHTAGLKLARRFTETLTARASGGLILIVDRGEVRPDFLIGLGVDQSYSETLSFHADYTRDVAVVGGLVGTFATNVFSGSLTAHVTKVFDSIVAGSWAIQQAILSSQSDLDTFRFRLEEHVKFTNWLRLFLSYEYMKQNYHNSTPDIYNNRVMVGLILSETFPPRP